MLVTAAPLIDIAPLERATMPNRVVTQYDKRDVETLKLIKLDLLGLGMLAAIDTTLQLIEHDCAACLDLDRMPEEIPEVFAMLQAADTVGVFQVESRAQMQTLPKSRPMSLDDLVVEVAIIRPGPIQGNAVHPYLRRKQGLEPVTYLHPSLEPVLRDTLGVILYQEQVMEIAIRVAGFSAADSGRVPARDGHVALRRARWRSCTSGSSTAAWISAGWRPDDAEELFRQVAGVRQLRLREEPRGCVRPDRVRVLVPEAVLPRPVHGRAASTHSRWASTRSRCSSTTPSATACRSCRWTSTRPRTTPTTEWVGRPGWAIAGAGGDDGSHDQDPGEALPDGAGIARRPPPVRSSACIVPSATAREQWAAESATDMACASASGS